MAEKAGCAHAGPHGRLREDAALGGDPEAGVRARIRARRSGRLSVVPTYRHRTASRRLNRGPDSRKARVTLRRAPCTVRRAMPRILPPRKGSHDASTGVE